MTLLVLRRRPNVIITPGSLGNINLYLLLILRYFTKSKVLVWTLGYDTRTGFNPKARFTDKLRLALYSAADAVLFYSNQGRATVASHAKSTSHFFVAPNTLDTQDLLAHRRSLEESGRPAIRESLRIKPDHFVFVGRLLRDKEVDLLLRAMATLQGTHSSAELTIIGSGPEEIPLRQLARRLQLTGIRFLGELLDSQSVGRWLFASKALLHPGRLGLSAVHSLSFGTPIITQRYPQVPHVEGFSYIHDEINSLVSPENSPASFAMTAARLLVDPQLLDRLRRGAVRTASSEASVERMIEGFSDAIHYLVED